MPKLSDYLRDQDGTSTSAPEQPASPAQTRLAAAHDKRLKDHGPRLYRHTDGSLSPTAPPPNPLTVANRKLWRPLVEWCSLQDSGTELERARRSLRSGFSVSHQEHTRALQAIGMKPEFDAQGNWFGYDPARTDPLADPQHVLSTTPEPESALGEGVSHWAHMLAEAAHGVGRA